MICDTWLHDFWHNYTIINLNWLLLSRGFIWRFGKVPQNIAKKSSDATGSKAMHTYNQHTLQSYIFSSSSILAIQKGNIEVTWINTCYSKRKYRGYFKFINTCYSKNWDNFTDNFKCRGTWRSGLLLQRETRHKSLFEAWLRMPWDMKVKSPAATR